MTKKRPYSFMTADSMRYEVYASNAEDGYRKALRQGFALYPTHRMTHTYTTYGREGIDTGWRSLDNSKARAIERAHKKRHNLR